MLTNRKFSEQTLKHLVILILGNLRGMGLIDDENYCRYRKLNLENPTEAIKILSNDIKTLRPQLKSVRGKEFGTINNKINPVR